MKRFNKTNGMYALLIAVATMIGITIYGSCSADEDYDGFSSRDELFTLADGEMNLRSEGNGSTYQSCGIWCIAYLRRGTDMADKYDFVRNKATQLDIPTTGYIKTSKMVTLAQACEVNLNHWVTNIGENVPQDTVIKKLYEVMNSDSTLPKNVLGFDHHYVIGDRITNGQVLYRDPNSSSSLSSKNINEFSAFIY